MIFKETGNPDLPTIILLHGGGLSYWSLEPIANQLKNNFNIVTPIIDGHGEDGKTTFISIQDSADKLIDYIDNNHKGKIFAIGGLSLGAQIVVEVISRRNNIADYAIIESALVFPIKTITLLTVPVYKLFYGLIKQRWFSKLQAKSLYIPDDMFNRYYQDSLQISKQSLINISISNGNYQFKNSLANTNVKSLIIVGEKELKIMKKSAIHLSKTIKNSKLYVAPSMNHGELSLLNPSKYIELINKFIYKD